LDAAAGTASVKPIILPKDRPRDEVIAKVVRFLHGLAPGKAWSITVEPYKKRRSTSQNAYLWGVCYPTILQAGQLGNWTADDLHEFFLIDHFGSEIIEGFGKKRHRPLKRSSKLSTTEFMDYVAHIQQRCAELGIYIPDPNEEFQEKAA
jgi:hypothetical protein